MKSKTQKKYPSETVKLLQNKFPKFNRIALCYVNNPEYGVDISAEGKRLLNRAKNKEKPKPKSKVVSARVDDDVAERLNDYVKGLGLTVNEYLGQVIKEAVDETSMHEGVSEQDDILQDDL